MRVLGKEDSCKKGGYYLSQLIRRLLLRLLKQRPSAKDTRCQAAWLLGNVVTTESGC